MDTEIHLSVLSRLLQMYEMKKIPKSRGRERTIFAPNDPLKRKQKTYLINEMRSGVGAGPYAKGFVRSPRDKKKPPVGVKGHSCPHVGRKYVFEVDVKDCFHHVRPQHLLRTWRDFEKLSRDEIESRFRPFDPERLDRIAPPVGLVHLAFIPSMAVGGDMFSAALPQGSPLSPYLSNVAFKPIDFSINAYMRRMFGEGAYAYTRYADNLVISTDSGSAKVLKRIMAKILEEKGFPVNRRKFRFMKWTQRQSVCGVVVNEKANFPKYLRKRYRGRIGNLFKTATRGMMKVRGELVSVDDWRFVMDDWRHVAGMMSYASDVAPDFYEKYRDQLGVIKAVLTSRARMEERE